MYRFRPWNPRNSTRIKYKATKGICSKCSKMNSPICSTQDAGIPQLWPENRVPRAKIQWELSRIQILSDFSEDFGILPVPKKLTIQLKENLRKPTRLKNSKVFPLQSISVSNMYHLTSLSGTAKLHVLVSLNLQNCSCSSLENLQNYISGCQKSWSKGCQTQWYRHLSHIFGTHPKYVGCCALKQVQ